MADYTVTRSGEYYNRKGCNIHLCRMDLPGSAIRKSEWGLVASPELTFLQLAQTLDIQRLILLGIQMCAHPPGRQRDALTTKNKLRALLKKMPGFNGIRKANRAVQYIEGGSASIMESLVYMLLTLPNNLGGHGLRGARFNAEIRLNRKTANRLRQNYCYVDLFYGEPKVAIEYDSFAFHNTPSEQGRDAIRSAILRKRGIELMHLKTIQLYDDSAWDDFVANLAQRLGKQINIRTEKFDDMHRQLRSLLPGASENESP